MKEKFGPSEAVDLTHETEMELGDEDLEDIPVPPTSILRRSNPPTVNRERLASVVELQKGPPPPPKRERMTSGVDLRDSDVMDSFEPGEFQEADVVDAFEIRGYEGIQVAATLEKKDSRKNSAESNEDSIIADPETGLMGVLDGLGGEGAGDKASQAAERLIVEQYQRALDKKLDASSAIVSLIESQLAKKNPSSPEIGLQYRKQLTEMLESIAIIDPAIVQRAEALIRAMQQSNDGVRESSGKTTASVGMIHRAPDGRSYAIVATIGDSPVLKRRNNGELIQITQEDSVLNALRDSGTISEEQLRHLKNNPEETFRVPVTLELVRAMGGGEKDFEALKNKGISEMPMTYKKMKSAMIGSLGATEARPTLVIREMKPGEELIFATDGLTDKFETPDGETDIEAMRDLFQGKSVTEDLNRARQAAKGRTSAAKKDDDTTILTARVL